jgi:serine/threonine protein kinase
MSVARDERRKPPRNSGETHFLFRNGDAEPLHLVAQDASTASARFSLSEKPLIEPYLNGTGEIDFGRGTATCDAFQLPPELENPVNDTFVAMYRTRQHGPGVIKEGTLARYEIEEFLGAGRTSETYRARVTELKERDGFEQGETVVLKVPLLVPYLPDDEINLMSSRLETLFRRDEPSLRRLKNSPSAAGVLDAGTHRFPIAGTAPTRFIVQRYIHGLPLREYFRMTRASPETGAFTGLTSEEFYTLATMLVEAVRDVHSRRVVHGDIWPENIMISDTGAPALIDFGQAAFREAAPTIARVSGSHLRYLAPERGPSIRADLFSLGGVLYYLATGDDPPQVTPGVRSDVQALAAGIRGRLAEKNDQMFWEVRGIADVLARCMCTTDQRYPDTNALIEHLDRFFIKPTISALNVFDALEQTVTDAERLDTSSHPLLRRMVTGRIRDLRTAIATAATGASDVVGDPSVIAGSMTQFLAWLGEGDQYLTISTPQFWRQPNPGADGEFLSMNIMAAERGAAIKRLIVVRPEDETDEFREIMQTQIAAMREAAEFGVHGSYEVKLWFTDAAGDEAGMNEMPHFGLFVTADDVVAAYPDYRTDGSIVAVRYRAGERAVGSLELSFYPYWMSDRAVELNHCPTTEEIKNKAYDLSIERGGAPGSEMEDWIRARRVLIEG